MDTLVSRTVMSIRSHDAPRADLDSHADTCAFGIHCYVLHTYPQTVNVSGFHTSMKTLDKISIACVAIAYDCLLTHQTYILIFDQVLHIPTLETSLICPDQLREQGIIVNDIPLQRLHPSDRNQNSHSIIDANSKLHIPLHFEKPISFFYHRKPTRDEATDSLNFLHVHMTSEVEWQPYDPQSFSLEESLRQQHQGDTADHRCLRSLSCSPAYRLSILIRSVML